MKPDKFSVLAPLALGIAAIFAFGAQPAAADPAVDEAAEQTALSDPNAIDCSLDSVDEWQEKVRESFGLGDWGEHGGKIFAFAMKTAAYPATDPQFGNALSAAFELAMQDIQQQVTMIRSGRVATEKAYEFFSDDSSAAREIPLEIPAADRSIAAKAQALLDKSLDVAGAKLDKELQRLGVAPGEVEKLPAKKKKTLFKELFVKEMVKNAAGDIAGIFPVQSTVVIDKDGNATVGVVAVFSPKTVQVAKDVAAQRQSIVTGKGRDLATMVPKNVSENLGTLGTRLVYDENGEPALVSYAVAAYIPDGDDAYINSTRKNSARQKAIDLADAQLAESVSGQMSVRNSRQTGQSVEKIVEREMTANSLSTERVVKDMVETVSTYAKSQAGMRLQGVSTLNTKFFKIPSGQQFYAVARVWKFSTLKAVDAINKGAYEPPRPKAADPAAASGATPGRFESVRHNTLEDF